MSAHTGRNTRRHVGWGAASILVIVYALVPVVWIISLSLKKSSDLQDGKFFPSSITWDNYSKIFDQNQFTAAILTFIFAWNDFLFAISLTSSDRARTAPAAIAFFNGNSQFQQPTGSIAAAAVIITIPIVVMVLIFQRRIVSGLTSGAVKG